MPKSVELERRFLAKRLPDGLENCESKEILDIYIPSSERHPQLRIRKNGSKFSITRKVPLSEDLTQMTEETLVLSEAEFGELASIRGKRVHKMRYDYNIGGRLAEINVFLDGLEGLVLVDFEFENLEEMRSFVMPDFCLADVSGEEFVAGGFLCGKGYADIETDLSRLNYVRFKRGRN